MNLSNQKTKRMDFVELIQKYQEETTPEQMLEITKVIGKFVAKHATEEDLHHLYKDIYGVISEGHFDRHFAEDAINRMYYEDESGVKHHAPFFTDAEVKEVFDLNKDDISDYTIHDLAVTMNMLRSDNNRFLEKYAKNTSEVKEMVSCMAIEYLQDPDAPHPTTKIWDYING